MAKDDIFRIIYIMLKELYEHKKAGTKAPIEDIGPQRFQITDGYWIYIITELSANGYITGLKIRETKTGRVVSGLGNIDITLKGIEYLQDNSMMRKVCEALKGLIDIAPGL